MREADGSIVDVYCRSHDGTNTHDVEQSVRLQQFFDAWSVSTRLQTAQKHFHSRPSLLIESASRLELGRATAAIAAQLGRTVESDEFIIMLSGLNGALPAGVRVVREASTYLLCEIEEMEPTLAALERRSPKRFGRKLPH